MEKPIAIDTCLGVLHGRDCIFLDGVQQDERGNLTVVSQFCHAF